MGRERGTYKMYKIIMKKEKEIIGDKNLMYDEIKKQIRELGKHHIVVPNALRNSVNNLSKKYKQITEEENVVYTNDNNNYTIIGKLDELKYNDEIYNFLKTRFVVEKSESYIAYIFRGKREKLNVDLLFQECRQMLKREKEFADIIK